MNDSQQIHRLVYVSTSIEQYTEAELNEILTISRINNSRNGITGILIYNDGNILQVLEGEKRKIHQLYGKITQDRRHYGCIILQDTPSFTRSFEDWSMGYRSVSQIEFLQLEGYWDLRSKNLPLIKNDHEHSVRTILDIFVEHNR
ncbi:MAG TPA: BLUF domain-containing protein [Pedobacter sp.]